MPKALSFQLTEEGLREIVEAIKDDKRPEVRQRAMGLRLLHEGKSPKEVAEFLGVSQPTVYDWHHRWQREGVEGLVNRPKPGQLQLCQAVGRSGGARSAGLGIFLQHLDRRTAAITPQSQDRYRAEADTVRGFTEGKRFCLPASQA